MNGVNEEIVGHVDEERASINMLMKTELPGLVYKEILRHYL